MNIAVAPESTNAIVDSCISEFRCNVTLGVNGGAGWFTIRADADIKTGNGLGVFMGTCVVFNTVEQARLTPVDLYHFPTSGRCSPRSDDLTLRNINIIHSPADGFAALSN